MERENTREILGFDSWALLDGVPDGMLVLDTNAAIRYSNAALRRLDVRESFVHGAPFVDAASSFFGVSRSEVEPFVREVLTGRSQFWSTRLDRRLELGVRRMVMEVRPFQVDEKRGGFVRIWDATEQGDALVALQESEARWRTLVEGSPDIVFITDSSSRMIYANRALEDQTGYTAADFQMPQRENTFIHKDDQAYVGQAIADFMQSDRLFSDAIENRFVTKDGRILWYSSVLSKTTHLGAPALQFVVHNITATREAERQSAERFEEAQRAVRLRDEFLSIAAHELKTPLTSLRAYAQWITELLEQDRVLPDALFRKAIHTIDRQSLKLTRLIEQLLDIPRLEGGSLALSIDRVDLTKLIRDVVDEALIRWDRKIELQLPEQMIVEIDGLRFEQVLRNLVDNALKFSPETAPVRIESAGNEKSDQLVLQVIDDGPGVAATDRLRIFDRFYQVPGSRRSSGIGLGLHVSRQIVELHGGTLHVEDREPGASGSRFVLRLPCKQT